MSTLIAYWKGSTKRRLLRGLAGLAACLAPMVWLALNPGAAIRFLDWGLTRKRANRHTTTAIEPRQSGTTANASPVSESRTALSLSEQTQSPENPSILHPAIAASIGAPRVTERFADASLPVAATGNRDEHNLEILQRVCNLLKSGRERFSHFRAYSATFFKRERIGAEIADLATIELKVRQQPFAVYLKGL
jgi:hypothetical protein